MFRGLFRSISAERFIKAARSNDLATVQSYIAENRNNVDAINRADPNNGMFFALMTAANEGHIEIVKALLGVPGIDPNVTDMTRDTPLIVAARRGHTAVVKALLSAPHIKLSVKNNQNLTAEVEARLQGHHEVADLITIERASRDFRRAAHNGDANRVQWYIGLIRDRINSTDDRYGLAALIRNNIPAFINAKDWNGLTALHRAASQGHVEVVQALLTVHEIDINIRDERGLTALSRAAHNGYADCVTAILATRRANINDVDTDGNTALIHAAYRGHTDVVRALLTENNIDLTIQNRNHLTAARAAVQRNHVDIVQLIGGIEVAASVRNLREGSVRRTVRFDDSAPAQSAATVTAEQFLSAARAGDLPTIHAYIAIHRDNPAAMNVNNNGFSAFNIATRAGHAEIVTALGTVPTTDVNAAVEFGITPLMLAIMDNHQNVVSALLALPHVEVNARDEDGDTALAHCVLRGRTDLLALLISDRRVDFSIANHDNKTALQLATRGQNNISHMLITAIEARIAAAAPSNRSVEAASGTANQSAATITARQFLRAAANGDLATVEAYIAVNRDNQEAMNVRGIGRKSALHFAATSGHESIVTALLAAPGTDVNATNEAGRTPLMLAAWHHPNIVTALLALPHVDVNARDQRGNTALLTSVLGGKANIAALLISDRRVDLTIADHEPRTALQLATSGGFDNIAQMLETAIAARIAAAALSNRSVEAASGTANPVAVAVTADEFLMAAQEGSLNTIQAYIAIHRDDPAAMNVRDDHNRSALQLAGLFGQDHIIAALIAASGTDVNIINGYGQTPLMRAVVMGKTDIVAALLALPRVEVNPRDHDGETALFYCIIRGRPDIAALLIRDRRVDFLIANREGQTALQLATSRASHDIARMIEAAIAERRAGASPSARTVQAASEVSELQSLITPIIGSSEPSQNIPEISIIPPHGSFMERSRVTSARRFFANQTISPSGPSRNIAETSTISPQRFLAAARDGEMLIVQSYIATHRRDLAGAMNVADPASGNTALIMAASAGRENIVSELLNTQGVNIETQNRNGLNAAEAAQLNGHAEIAVRLMQLLSARSAPTPAPQPSSTPVAVAAAAPKSPSPPMPLNFEQRLAAIGYEGKIPDHLMCPVLQTIMNDPVTIFSGYTLDRSALNRCFEGKGSTIPCPITRIPINRSELQNKSCINTKTLLEKFVSKQGKGLYKAHTR